MITSNPTVEAHSIVSEIQTLISQLGQGKTQATAYDTAWGARLAAHYPEAGFEASVEWLRRHQNEDGSWGGKLTHYHDRFISTLAAIVALKEVGRHPRDKRRIQRGENALWKLIGQLGRDDSDTVGFPILSTALVNEANALGLDVPNAPTRYAAAYRKKVDTLLHQPERNWHSTTLTFSFEALRKGARYDDPILGPNGSVGASLSATAAYLLQRPHDDALAFVRETLATENTGALPAIRPIDIFEIVWSLHYLQASGAVEPDDPQVRPLLDFLWSVWSPELGVGHSSQWGMTDIDDTAACYSVLIWGGYPVNGDGFNSFEQDDYFYCYPWETNPSLSAHVRLLAALRLKDEDARTAARIKKAVTFLYRSDENGSFWWDKWHASPYYVMSFALGALHGLADDLAYSRFKWVLRTQNDDGGWGYLGQSTAEETAYCLSTLLDWDRSAFHVDPNRLDAAASFLFTHVSDEAYVPLWIGKSLYTPYYPVKAAILGALFDYTQWSELW